MFSLIAIIIGLIVIVIGSCIVNESANPHSLMDEKDRYASFQFASCLIVFGIILVCISLTSLATNALVPAHPLPMSVY